MTNAELRALVERRAYIQFADRGDEPITPTEWFNLTVNVVGEILEGEYVRLPELEQEHAQLQLQMLNDIEAARKTGYTQALTAMAAMIDAFCTTKGLGAQEYADVSGMKRAAAMIRKEIA